MISFRFVGNIIAVAILLLLLAKLTRKKTGMKTLKEVVEDDTVSLRKTYETLTAKRFYREAGIVQIGCNVSLKPRLLLGLRFDQFVTNPKGERFIRDAESIRNLDFTNAACLSERDRLFQLCQRPADSQYLFAVHRIKDTGLGHVSRISVAATFRSNNCTFRGRTMVLEDLRRSWACRYLLNGGSLSTLRMAFNHASMQATIAYLELKGVEGYATHQPPNGSRTYPLFAPALFLQGSR